MTLTGGLHQSTPDYFQIRTEHKRAHGHGVYMSWAFHMLRPGEKDSQTGFAKGTVALTDKYVK